MRGAAGAVLSVAVAGIAVVIWDLHAAIVTGLFGLVATAIQVGAGRLMRGMRDAPTSQFLKRWGAGMGLRLGGVMLLAVAATLWPDQVPALPAAIGFLGVLIPMLALELRVRH